jgi:hypothetical protein
MSFELRTHPSHPENEEGRSRNVPETMAGDEKPGVVRNQTLLV